MQPAALYSSRTTAIPFQKSVARHGGWCRTGEDQAETYRAGQSSAQGQDVCTDDQYQPPIPEKGEQLVRVLASTALPCCSGLAGPRRGGRAPTKATARCSCSCCRAFWVRLLQPAATTHSPSMLNPACLSGCLAEVAGQTCFPAGVAGQTCSMAATQHSSTSTCLTLIASAAPQLNFQHHRSQPHAQQPVRLPPMTD